MAENLDVLNTAVSLLIRVGCNYCLGVSTVFYWACTVV